MRNSKNICDIASLNKQVLNNHITISKKPKNKLIHKTRIRKEALRRKWGKKLIVPKNIT